MISLWWDNGSSFKRGEKVYHLLHSGLAFDPALYKIAPIINIDFRDWRPSEVDVPLIRMPEIDDIIGVRFALGQPEVPFIVAIHIKLVGVKEVFDSRRADPSLVLDWRVTTHPRSYALAHRLSDKSRAGPRTQIKYLVAELSQHPAWLGAELTAWIGLRRDGQEFPLADWSATAGAGRAIDMLDADNIARRVAFSNLHPFRHVFNDLCHLLGQPGPFSVPGLRPMPDLPSDDPWRTPEAEGKISESVDKHLYPALGSMFHSLLADVNIQASLRRAGINPAIFAVTRIGTFLGPPRLRVMKTRFVPER